MASQRKQRQQKRSKIADDLKRKQRASIRPLEPRTEAQESFRLAILKNSVTLATGPAGTGKTYVPAAIAANMLLNGHIDKIILCRPAVEATGESLGYLPGKLEQKMQPWAMPFLDVLKQFMGPHDFRTALVNEEIEIIPFAYMRGRTFNNAFIVLDEAQNTTPEQIEMFLTRIGDDSRTVISGDLSQSDIDGESGLSVAMRMVSRYGIVCGAVSFERKDIVRSETCKIWATAFEREREGEAMQYAA